MACPLAAVAGPSSHSLCLLSSGCHGRALITFPLLVIGGVAGKRSGAEFQAPCRTTKYPREIPTLPWYRRTIPQVSHRCTTGEGVPGCLITTKGSCKVPTLPWYRWENLLRSL